jgi:hypothetical protein
MKERTGTKARTMGNIDRILPLRVINVPFLVALALWGVIRSYM